MTWINCRAVGPGRRCSCPPSSGHIAKDINAGTARSQSAIGGFFMTLWMTVNWLRTAKRVDLTRSPCRRAMTAIADTVEKAVKYSV